MADLKGFKAHLVAADAESDAQLCLYLEAAESFMERAGVPSDTDDPLYDLCAYQIGTYFCDNRNPATEVKISSLPMGVQGMLLQLRTP